MTTPSRESVVARRTELLADVVAWWWAHQDRSRIEYANTLADAIGVFTFEWLGIEGQYGDHAATADEQFRPFMRVAG